MKAASVILLILLFVSTSAQANEPWVDMTGCPICQNVSSEPGLMENMIWEHHLTATGVMTVSTIEPEYREKFEGAKKRMQATLAKVRAGEAIEVCGYCASLATLLNAGAQADNVVTAASDILVVSSTDEATIEQIHAHAQKTIDFVNSTQE